ncbi:MAG: hypothetical protein BGN99_03250 [Alphaproteobacteria bacterium 65-37]|jgi:Spy/CpxP family protein refolding chaperone|nr:periplasmic heavy metal sensor [Alphaproteobacteria bacterium]OJU32070.1 MAG: hypothetical protein BGN99_03250 [Alphaproteobacteria bacterium 65-37]
MTARLLQVLLVLSLLLNGFAIGGFVFRSWIAPPIAAGLLPPPPPPPPGTPGVPPRPSQLDIMTRELSLDTDQREALRSLIEQNAAQRRQRLAEIHKDRELVAVEMRQPQPDFAKVEALIDRVSTLRGELIKENLRNLEAFEPKLRPDQRERMYGTFADRFVGPTPAAAPRPGQPGQPAPRP